MRAVEGRVKVQSLLDALKEERSILPEFGTFGGNNWKGLDEAIDVLERILGEEYVNLDNFRDSEHEFGYDLAEWIDGGDSQSNIYNVYCN